LHKKIDARTEKKEKKKINKQTKEKHFEQKILRKSLV